MTKLNARFDIGHFYKIDMKRIIALLLILISLCGCHKSNIKTGYTFTDDLQRSVTVNKTDRVATLLGSYADLWMLAGGDVCATADDAWTDLGLNLDESTANIGSSHNPNIEKILISNPDFVIASSKMLKHIELKDSLENAGITVAFFDVDDFEDYIRVLGILTKITERNDLYKIYGQKQIDEINTIITNHKDSPVQNVLVLRASASSIRAKNSSGTMLGGMLKDFGCINIADNNEMILDNLSIESISQINPDKIFIVQMGNDTESTKKAINKLFDSNPLWKNLDAIKTENVYYMEKQLYNIKPNAKFIEAYKNLEKILYSE